jgi:diguanylate cyclase (GGDEF)-like protein
VYDHRYKQLTVMVAERVALALANLKLRESLQRQSIHDSLTGLFNRRYMETTLEREIRQAARKKEKIGLIMIDIDHFKQFNDQYGHAGGDKLLASVGEFLLRNVRAGDIACRYGGDEIILILPQANLDDSYQRAEMLREGIRHLLIDYQNTPLGQITASMGVASYPEHGDTLDPLLSAADGALYQAKEHGRDRVVVAPVLAKNEKK